MKKYAKNKEELQEMLDELRSIQDNLNSSIIEFCNKYGLNTRQVLPVKRGDLAYFSSKPKKEPFNLLIHIDFNTAIYSDN